MTINGFPKSGNHALWKACCLLGIPTNGVHHIAYGESEIAGKHVFIKRDPRNVVVSMLRFQGQVVTPGTFLTLFRRFDHRSLVESMSTYEGWLPAPGALVVAFEGLIVNDAVMRAIAAYCSVPYLPGAFEELPGLTRTWTGKHSDFRDVWTSDVERGWTFEGGNELLGRWGYQPVARGGI